MTNLEANLTFDDVLIKPRFSMVDSRADVDPTTTFLGLKIFPIISSNMDTVTSSNMAVAMLSYNAQACLHRFQSIESNVKEFKNSIVQDRKPFVSVGISDNEFERALALTEAGAEVIIIDVAHGASMKVVKFYDKLRNKLNENVAIVVGNFANAQSIKDFEYHAQNNLEAVKISVGSGGACQTRVVTGCGQPILASLLDCSSLNIPMIADGGIRNSGDFSKALSIADVVMCGKALAGSDESPGYVYNRSGEVFLNGTPRIDSNVVKGYYKRYRGSASSDSYKTQGKEEGAIRSYEGASFLIPTTGPVKNTLDQFQGGLRSAMSYVGARDLCEFKENVEFVKITNAGIIENDAHGRK